MAPKSKVGGVPNFGRNRPRRAWIWTSIRATGVATWRSRAPKSGADLEVLGSGPMICSAASSGGADVRPLPSFVRPILAKFGVRFRTSGPFAHRLRNPQSNIPRDGPQDMCYKAFRAPGCPNSVEVGPTLVELGDWLITLRAVRLPPPKNTHWRLLRIHITPPASTCSDWAPEYVAVLEFLDFSKASECSDFCMF